MKQENYFSKKMVKKELIMIAAVCFSDGVSDIVLTCSTLSIFSVVKTVKYEQLIYFLPRNFDVALHLLIINSFVGHSHPIPTDL